MRSAVRLAAFALCLAALASAGWCAPKVTKEFTLPTFSGSPFRPRISGDWVVALQNKDDKACASSSYGVIVYNAATGQTYTVYNGVAGWCDVNGYLACWTGKSDSVKNSYGTLKGDRCGAVAGTDLILLDMRTWNYYTPTLSARPAILPVVCGTNCAYEARDNQIHLVDLNTAQQKTISSGSVRHGNAAIGGDLVVWEEATNKQRIHGYRISTGDDIAITDEPGARGPRTDGKTVVWWGAKEGVTAYDVASTVRKQISKTGFYASVDDGIAVYLKSANGGSAVYGYDLSTDEEFRISKGVANQGPSISGNRVIWCYGNKIYCAELDKGQGSVKPGVGHIPEPRRRTRPQ